ncbi:enoyl-CoA hydratase [Nitratireductor indicus C115]|uniref:Enoyl-CoA hydratase domain-containing protein 3, mitochondrial n=1 Tax=Nitratireductor indicus C115 TaxID=1231190 RepID=K2P644_9HYPH|nr:enoyl-CoA hydratase [Nitratireductor indicus]EKF42796.1 enoyl-CoA hydratase [Nitratireductor indicus C115]SFQ40359.1 Enoyl-CoA hydratase/carnithine racemase [Nitratireductor indicus]
MGEAALAGEHAVKPLVSASSAEGLLTLTMANPPANALSIAMMEALKGALERARDDAGVRVIVLRSGEKLFSAGHDLKELTAHRKDTDRGRAFFEKTMELCAGLMQTIVRHPKPVIAEVDGVATAAGCQLVASCDLAVASDVSRFATPGVNIGLFCSTPMVALSRNVSRKHAMEMLLTGEMMDAETARSFGLLNRVVARDALGETVKGMAKLVASKSSLTVKIGKEAFYHQAEMNLSEAYDYTVRVMVENMLARDAEEGIGAFIEKRAPEWQDK